VTAGFFDISDAPEKLEYFFLPEFSATVPNIFYDSIPDGSLLLMGEDGVCNIYNCNELAPKKRYVPPVLNCHEPLSFYNRFFNGLNKLFFSQSTDSETNEKQKSNPEELVRKRL